MVNMNLVGRCGIYCGSCIIYRAFKDSAKLRESIARDNECSPEDVKCGGCQTAALDGWGMDKEWGRNCAIVKCVDGKGIDFCYECDDYPRCEKFSRIAESYLKKGEDLVENLAKIKSGKVEEWLKEEDARWRCPECDGPISIHLSECHICGKNL